MSSAHTNNSKATKTERKPHLLWFVFLLSFLFIWFRVKVRRSCGETKRPRMQADGGCNARLRTEEEKVVEHVVDLTAKLLRSIAEGDWESYVRLCDPDLTCFEPEARGHLVEGMPFHKFYFELAQHKKMKEQPLPPAHTTMVNVKVKALGKDAAVVSYVRLTQCLDDAQKPLTKAHQETRVWQRKDNGDWLLVHFHRSA
ncbi:Calcium/calmodulin-dependent protein kinase type II subunit alpha [Balamuthia mandrillaris]